MAEQALIADLRINLSKFDADLKRAMQSAEKASGNISSALNKVDASLKPLPAEFNKLNNSLKQTEQATDRATQASERQSRILSTLKGALGALGLVVTAQQMLQFAASSIKAAEAMTGVSQQLRLLTGSSKAAAAEMQFIRRETERLALSTIEGAKAYARIANAAKGTRIEGEGTRRIFVALNEMARANRMSTDEYGRVLTQVTQIIAKGRVQTEELITLSESGIPAFRMLGEAMGVTGKKLAEMLQKGQVSSDNILLLADKIHKEYSGLAEAASSTIPAQFARGMNRIKMEFVDLAQGILNSSQLINAIKFESNLFDIFPDPQVISDTTNNIVRAYVLISEMGTIVFQGVRNAIIKAFSDVIAFLQRMMAPIDNFFNSIADKARDFIKDTLGIDIKKGAEEGATAFGKLGKAIGEVTTMDVGGMISQFSGVKGIQLLKNIEAARNSIAKFFGVETEPPIMLDPVVIKGTADKTEDIYSRMLKNIKDDANKIQPLIDPVTEAEAAKTIASMRKKVRRQEMEEEERHQKELVKMRIEAEKAIQSMAKKLEEEKRKEQDEVHQGFLRVLDRTNQARIAQDQKVLDDFNKTIENMKENVQRTMASTLSDAMRGDIDSIQDVADRITDIFTETASNIASEFIAAFAIDPLINQMKGALAKLQGLTPEQVGAAPGGQMTTGGAVLGAVGGIGAGVGVGMGVSQMAGGGKLGGALGGATGGVVAGATIGTLILPGLGTAVGAAAGAIIGAIAGGLMAKDKQKTSIISQTSAGFPAAQETNSFSRSPFGIVTMFQDAKVSKEVANSATMAIAEIDAGIAQYLDKSQREIVQNYFQTAVPEGSKVEAQKADDAIAKAIQLRLFQAITAISGQDIATNVVGQAFTADASNIQAIQQRAMEALQILKTIEEFKVGPLSETASAIKQIRDEFQQLIDRATTLGLPIDQIVAEQQRLLTEVTTNFNQDITDSILAITDPAAAEFAKLDRLQKERVQNAIDAGGDLVAVEKLNALEREELQKRLGQSATAAGNAVQSGLIDRLNAFTMQGMSSTSQAIASLTLSFNQLSAEMQAAGMSTASLTASFQAQVEALRQQANNQVLGALYSITDPFKGSMLQINQQVSDFQKLVDEGFVPQATVDAYRQAAEGQAREQERARQQQASQQRAQEREQRRAEQEQRRQQVMQFRQALLGFTNPVAAAMIGVNEQIKEFRELVKDGLIPRKAFNQFKQLSLASVQVDRALSAISGGGGTPIEQIGEAFKQFIQQGKQVSPAVQAMRDLQQQFSGLVESAKILGLSTKDLKNSYLEQAKAIREQAIQAIDQSLQGRRDALAQIDDYLNKFKVSDVLPPMMRLNEARGQFLQNVKTDNVQGALQSADQYLNIAREQYGSTAGFFSIRNEVQKFLEQVQQRESAAIETERARLIRQEERQLEQVQIGRSSVDYLRRISNDNSDTARGISQLIAIAKSQTSEQVATRQLLLRLTAKIKA